MNASKQSYECKVRTYITVLNLVYGLAHISKR